MNNKFDKPDEYEEAIHQVKNDSKIILLFAVVATVVLSIFVILAAFFLKEKHTPLTFDERFGTILSTCNENHSMEYCDNVRTFASLCTGKGCRAGLRRMVGPNGTSNRVQTVTPSVE